ncbi:unnamed protein product [Porites evermanni]|uniref:G-protein coupled receptors family 1 profile domain-containing protein n=1 Tax=Porites evermanni TaxID=104178 RepID=A0ABN8SJ90_9CNID|nr:unnamed protein product [Porites evermanni]
MTTMGFAFCGVSFGTMALISVDRYLALLYHLEYRSRVTTYRVVITMSFVWFLHFILLNRFWVPPKYIYIGFALLLIYITVATVSYLQIYRIVRRHQLQIQNQNQAVLSRSNSLSQKRSATNTLVFYVSAVICYFPWCVYRIAHGDIFVANINTAWIFTTSLVFANSAINPFLYGDWNSSDQTHATIVLVNCALNAPLILLSTAGNVLVLVALSKTSYVHSTSVIMLASLAFSDLLVGLLAQPLFIVDELKSLTTQDPILYRLSAMIGFFVGGVSLGTITAISVDRFMSLHYHMRYAIIVTNTRVKYTVGAIWLAIFLSLIFYLWNKYIFHLLGGVFSAVCIIISTISYVKIYQIVRYHQSQIHIQHHTVGNTKFESKMRLARLKQSAMNTFIFYICMIFCYFPHFVLLIIFGTLHIEWTPEWTFSTTAVFMNSSINPILYCWRLFLISSIIVKKVLFRSCIKFREGNDNRNGIYSSPTEVISDAILFVYLCVVPSQKMQALVTRDGTICTRNSAFGYFDGTNPITGNGLQLRSPTPNMAPDGI